jgi:membrane protein YdbS with pleckstrin-like domain
VQFDRPQDPSPLAAAVAVSRGQRLISWPVRLLMFGGIGAAYVLFYWSPWAAVIVTASGILLAWLWWSYFIPQWRSWAIERGADPEELQRLGVQSGLVPQKGSFFERTEIRRKGR